MLNESRLPHFGTQCYSFTSYLYNIISDFLRKINRLNCKGCRFMQQPLFFMLDELGVDLLQLQ